MTVRLEFGRPRDPMQALIRLPGREHPDYETVGGPIEHLTHFKEHLTQIALLVLEGTEISLEERWLPLEIEDMRLLEKVSFTRSPKPILTTQWGKLRDENFWAGLVPSNWDGEYRWWQISRMQPSLNLPQEYDLFCIETNSRFMRKNTACRFNQDSVFDLFVVSPKELQALQEELTWSSR